MVNGCTEKTLAECIDTEIMGGYTAMVCPECGDSYGMITSIGQRNGDYIVSFEEESKEHAWDIRFHWHKGITYATVEPMKNLRLSANLIEQLKKDPKNQYVIDKLVEEITCTTQ